MNDQPSAKERNPAITSLITVLDNRYGQIAFGLIAVMIIWKIIMLPQLEANRIDTKAMQTVADTIRLAVETANKTADTANQTAETAKDTAQANERASLTLDNAADTLKEAATTLKKP